MVEPVVLVPLDVNQVAGLGDVRALLNGHAILQIKLRTGVFELAAGGHIAPLALKPCGAIVAAGLHRVGGAQQPRTVVRIRLRDAPGNELRAPLAVRFPAPIAVLAVSALGRGIAQLIDGDREQHVRALIRKRHRHEQAAQRDGKQKQCDQMPHVILQIGLNNQRTSARNSSRHRTVSSSRCQTAASNVRQGMSVMGGSASKRISSFFVGCTSPRCAPHSAICSPGLPAP